jgi:cysteinyl-tRNA synthetase
LNQCFYYTKGIKLFFLDSQADVLTGGTDLQFAHPSNDMARAKVEFNNDILVTFVIYIEGLMFNGSKMEEVINIRLFCKWI